MDPRRKYKSQSNSHNSGYGINHQVREVPQLYQNHSQQQYQNNNYSNTSYPTNNSLHNNQVSSYSGNSQSYNSNAYYQQTPQIPMNQGQFYNPQQMLTTSQNHYGTQNMVYNNQSANGWSSQPQTQAHRQIMDQPHYNSAHNTYLQSQPTPLIQQHDNNISSNYRNLNNNSNPIYQPNQYTNINQSNNFSTQNSTSQPHHMPNQRNKDDSNHTRNQSIIRVPIGTTRPSMSSKDAAMPSKEIRTRHSSSDRTIARSNSPPRGSSNMNISRSSSKIKKKITSEERNFKKRPQSYSIDSVDNADVDMKKSRFINLYDSSNGAFANNYKFPAIKRDSIVLDAPGLLSRYNKLKVPDDFVKMEVDWKFISNKIFAQGMNMNIISKLDKRATIHSTLKPTEYCTNSALLHQAYNTPRLSVINNLSNTAKPIVYNAKILITNGYAREMNSESLDHSFCKNLNIICGNRNDKAQLLGTSWCKELDGGDPDLDQSCLLNTARRAVLSQSLIDIFTDCSDILKLCEVVYSHQNTDLCDFGQSNHKEINVIYLCSLSTKDNLSPTDFELKWSLYCDRMHGKTIHPVLNLDLTSHNSNEELYSFLLRDKSFVIYEEETIESDCKSNIVQNVEKKCEDNGTESSDLTMANNVKNIETKPETSCIIICPQPLPRDIYNDGSKQKNSCSLMVSSIDDVLAHSGDCDSDLLFEAIMAVEILKSLICTHFANIIVSFILSEHETLSSAIDLYVRRVVKKLRQINNKVLISSSCTTEEEKTQSTDNINNSGDNTSKIVGDDTKIKKTKVDLDETTTVDFEINRDPTMIETNHIFDTILTSASEISETESRRWRRNFLNSCKWFDKDHVSYIPFEILELIFYLSDIPETRELTQKEIYTICSKLCKEDNKKLSFSLSPHHQCRYEVEVIKDNVQNDEETISDESNDSFSTVKAALNFKTKRRSS